MVSEKIIKVAMAHHDDISAQDEWNASEAAAKIVDEIEHINYKREEIK